MCSRCDTGSFSADETVQQGERSDGVFIGGAHVRQFFGSISYPTGHISLSQADIVSHHGEVMAGFTRFEACEDSFIISDDLVELCLLRDSDLSVKVVADDGAISAVEGVEPIAQSL